MLHTVQTTRYESTLITTSSHVIPPSYTTYIPDTIILTYLQLSTNYIVQNFPPFMLLDISMFVIMLGCVKTKGFLEAWQIMSFRWALQVQWFCFYVFFKDDFIGAETCWKLSWMWKLRGVWWKCSYCCRLLQAVLQILKKQCCWTSWFWGRTK